MEDRTDVLGRRIGAALLDLVVVVILAIILAMLIGNTETEGASASFSLEGMSALVWFAVVLLYYGLSEALTGQTLGKRLLGVRVATLEGGRASGGQVALRTLLRVVDGFAFYLVGLVAVLATGQKRQRLGDMAAKTTVVAANRAG